MKPGFLFVGPTKSGTTWIDAYLRERGDVALPTHTKETYFFDKLLHKGIGWYEKQFPPGEDHPCCVEVAPSLFHKPQAAERAARLLPGATIIITVRNPVDRAVSHYFHYRKAGEPGLNLDEMIRRKPDIAEASLYYANIRRWEELFGADKVSCLFYGDLAADPVGFCRQLCSVLGLPFIEPSAALRSQSVNEGGIPRNALLAKLARRATYGLRMLGATRLISLLKSEKLKSLAFSGGDGLGDEKARIKEQARQLEAMFSRDIAAFEAHIGRSIRAGAG